MAERLTAADGPADALGNISQASILNFIQELKAAESEIGTALVGCKNARAGRKAIFKRIKDAGIRRDAFDRAYADNERFAGDREEEDKHYRYLMAMLGKPVAGDEAPAESIETPQHRELRMDKVRADGVSAGRSGYNAGLNPWEPGSEPHAEWQNGWIEGQAAKVHDELSPPQDQRGARRKAVLSAKDFPACPHHPEWTSGSLTERYCGKDGCDWIWKADAAD